MDGKESNTIEPNDQLKNERSESGFDSICEQAIDDANKETHNDIPAAPTRTPPRIPIDGDFFCTSFLE